jgi:hypothetical protein
LQFKLIDASSNKKNAADSYLAADFWRYVSLKNEKIQYLVATNSDMKSSYMRTKKRRKKNGAKPGHANHGARLRLIGGRTAGRVPGIRD